MINRWLHRKFSNILISVNISRINAQVNIWHKTSETAVVITQYCNLAFPVKIKTEIKDDCEYKMYLRHSQH